MGGATDLKQGGHKNTGNKAYWGEQTLAGHKVEKVPAQQTYTKKDPRELIPKDTIAKFDRNATKKVAVPKMDEKPIMGLVSDKNFIVSNAVENILAAPKLPGNSNKDYLKKKNYGKVP